MVRALGRLAPDGALTPSAYAAGAMRIRSVPALPRLGLARLFPTPPMGEAPVESNMRSSRASHSRRTGVGGRPWRRGAVVRGWRGGHQEQGFMAVPREVLRAKG